MEELDPRDPAVRFAIFLEHQRRDFYDGEPFGYEFLELDHVIPQRAFDSPVELAQLKSRFALPDGFSKNCILNLVPARRRTNNLKRDTILQGTGIYLERTRALADKIEKRIASLRTRHSTEDLAAALMTQFASEDEMLRYFDALCQQDKESFKPHSHTSSETFLFSNGIVSVHCHLPRDVSMDSSCLITLNSLKLRDCMFTFSDASIRDTFVPNAKSNAADMKRRFLWQRDKENGQYFVQLNGVTFPLIDKEVDALCEAIDTLVDHHAVAEARVRSELGLADLRKAKNCDRGYVLGLVTPPVWQAMVQYAREFDYEAGCSEFHFYDATGSCVKMASREGDPSYESIYHSAIQGIRADREFDSFIYEDKMAVIWTPLIMPEGNKFSERAIWSGRMTQKFLMTKMLPRAIYRATVARKFFAPEFETWVSDFDVSHYFSAI